MRAEARITRRAAVYKVEGAWFAEIDHGAWTEVEDFNTWDDAIFWVRCELT